MHAVLLGHCHLPPEERGQALSCALCPHCTDKTSPEAIALGHQVEGIRLPLPARKFVLLTSLEGIEAILAWWERARTEPGRPRLAVELVALPAEIEMHVRPPAHVYRRRRKVPA